MAFFYGIHNVAQAKFTTFRAQKKGSEFCGSWAIGAPRTGSTGGFTPCKGLHMNSRRKSRPSSTSKALARTPIFGPPPILQGEDAHAYEELAMRVCRAVKPTSII